MFTPTRYRAHSGPEAYLYRRMIAAMALALAAGAALLPARAPAQESPPAPRTLRLLAGAQQEIRPGQPLERVAVGNPAVADALLLKHRNGPPSVLVVAKKPGATDLKLWTRNAAPLSYTVRVDAVAADADGAQVDVSAAGATISGQSPDAAAAYRAQQAARAAVGGTASGADGKPGGVVVDRSTLPVSGTVQVDVKVVEISKTVLKEVGLNFIRNKGGFTFAQFSPSSLTKVDFTSGVGTAGEMTSPISSAFNLIAASASKGIFANLSLLEANGMVRVLAEPSLVALSGQSASFLAGGEIPIPVPQALGTTTIQFKPFGIGLTVSPTVLSGQRIALKVAPEASDLDPSRGIQINGASVPAIVTRRADTTVELGDGESFVIGGLVSRNTVSNVSKIPFLGDLPILGSFFKNLNFHRKTAS